MQVTVGSCSTDNPDAGHSLAVTSGDDVKSRTDMGIIGVSQAPMPTGRSEDREITEVQVGPCAEAASLESGFEHLAIAQKITEIIEGHDQILLLTPDELGESPDQLYELGASFHFQFEQFGELADIEKAIGCLSQVVKLTPGHSERPYWLGTLGDFYRSRFNRFGERPDLDKAIQCNTAAMILTPEGQSYDPTWLINLGNDLVRRFERFGELSDVDLAIECHTEAVLVVPDDLTYKPSLLSILGNSYLRRFRYVGELPGLEKAIEHHTQALLLTLDDDEAKPSRLVNLGNCHRCRFERLGDLEDVEKAIDYQTQAVLLTPDANANKPGCLNNLGYAYLGRFERLGVLADLNKAIEHLSQAVLLTSDSHSNKGGVLLNLGNSYMSRFEQLGEIADADKAIECGVKALLLTPDDHETRLAVLANVGISYARQHEHLREIADLNEAIKYLCWTVQYTPENHSDHPGRLENLGVTYLHRFQALGELKDLDKAIDCQTQAMLLTPDDHAKRPNRLSNLGVSYQCRYKRLLELVDLEKSIDFFSQAELLIPDGHPTKPSILGNLGASYSDLFDHLSEPADVDKAIECQSRVLALTADSYPNKPRFLYDLGDSYLSRFKHSHKVPDILHGLSFFQHAAMLVINNPMIQLICARRWASCSILIDHSPLMAYQRCMELIPHLVWLGTTIERRYTLINQVSDLATEAAASAISAQEYDLALEWLEAGRSIVWNQILQLRTPFDDLAVVDPVLAQQLKDTATKLENEGTRQAAAVSLVDTPFNLENAAQHHRRLAAEWEQLPEQARNLPGFQDFMRSRKATEIKLAAKDGPIVLINAHSSRCDALIIFPGCDDVAHVPLEGCSLDKLIKAREQSDSLVGSQGDIARGFKCSKPVPRPEEKFKDMLVTLWLDVVKPVLDSLACTRKMAVDEMPHVTWCTTGALSFLPLHAAGSYNGVQPNTFDLVVSSYTPTLNALLSANIPALPPDIGVLVVGQEHTPGFCSLPNVAQELSVIKDHAKLTRFQQLDGQNATVDAVLGAMEKHSWVHLACHATQNPDHPSRSGFYLHEGSLTLEAITKCSFKNKGLAFLSACQTATGDKKLSDEAVHLAAGMLMAGYPSVIATMWKIQDEDGPQVAQGVYAELLKDGANDHTKASWALHKAAASLREKVGHEEFMR